MTIQGRQYLGILDQGEFTQLITRVREMHPCSPVGQSSDRESTGERSLGMASTWFRGIPNIRVMDIDKLAYCPRCYAPLLWIEEKTTQYSPDEWQMMRHLARITGGHAMFFLEWREGAARIWIYPEIAPDLGKSGKLEVESP